MNSQQRSRSIVVAGAATGIGRAVAARLAARGDEVVLTGRRPEPLEKAAAEVGGRAVAFEPPIRLRSRVHSTLCPSTSTSWSTTRVATGTSTRRTAPTSPRSPPHGGPTS